jgi:hypothetical protein
MKRLILLVLILITSTLSAQQLRTPVLSPITKITQQVGLTEIGLEYSRPSARGRTIFGDLVPYDVIWRTGANASTKLTFSEPAFINQKPVPAGTYALYTIPGEKEWTIIIHTKLNMRSLAGDAYQQENDLFRFTVKSEHVTEPVETFTIQFADLSAASVNLRLSWEHTAVTIPLSVEVDSKIAAQMKKLLEEPDNVHHRTYFSAAQYYLTNDKDLNTALEWIDAALGKSERNFRYGLLKAKIQHKKGDRDAALSTIDEAHSWARDANNANYMEQTDLFRKSIKK